MITFILDISFNALLFLSILYISFSLILYILHKCKYKSTTLKIFLLYNFIYVFYLIVDYIYFEFQNNIKKNLNAIFLEDFSIFLSNKKFCAHFLEI